jgi:hypothetical protein
MRHMKKEFNISLIQFIISLIVIAVSIATAYGANLNRINNLEYRMDNVKSDHDLLICLSTKMDVLLVDVKDVKADLKKHIEASIP